MEAALTVIFGLLGTAIGSFLNLSIDRLPRDLSIIRPPSHCDACGHRLSARDLIPVFSYLLLRRRCHYCHASVPQRNFWVEVGTGLLFAFLHWHYGLTVELAVTAFYCSLLILLMVIDLEHNLILNKIVYPAAVVALIIGIFLPEPGILYDTIGRANGAIGGAIGFILLLIPALIYRGGMGWGDVKMAGLIGIMTGFPKVFVALLGAVFLGGLVAVMLLLFKKRTRKQSIPFGPFLSLAAIATLLWGDYILNWYLGMF